MRGTWSRNGAAAGLFAAVGIGALVLGIVIASIVLAAAAALAFVAAVAAARGFPTDREW